MLSGDVQFTIDKEENVLVKAVYDYHVGLRILRNASAIAGNFLTCDPEGAAEIVFAPLDVNLAYAGEALRRTSV